jgi:hypothetical protein
MGLKLRAAHMRAHVCPACHRSGRVAKPREERGWGVIGAGGPPYRPMVNGHRASASPASVGAMSETRLLRHTLNHRLES